MSDPLRHISSYLGHFIKARSEHGVHSPFVYDLMNKVLRPTEIVAELEPIEALRDELARSKKAIRVNDLGAGSRVFDLPIRRVADIARTSLMPRKNANTLFRLARYFRPTHVLELGTSFGISTLYLAKGADEGTVTTIEGCPQTHRIALDHFDRLKQTNIIPILGSFGSRLTDAMRPMDRLDLAFLDGHHAKQPTLDYFEQCLGKTHDDSVIVLDDIHWSQGMEEAWEEIKRHPKVTVTLDLYDMGIVLLRTEQAPEHFVLRY